ncbi:MAG: rhodanese-like domain-containing protein [Gammaproteobacteria bacterium]|nr:MAG: rhodanese-like domain-containing protein [Gammaproteobacteria bacterium]
MRLNSSRYSFIVISLFALTFACALVQAGEAIGPSVLADRINTGNAPFILDVRSTGEYANGHIPGAVNIPYRQLRDRLSELMAYQEQEIVVHCQVGPRADIARSILSAAGFVRIHELEGHMRAWEAGSYPIE